MACAHLDAINVHVAMSCSSCVGLRAPRALYDSSIAGGSIVNMNRIESDLEAHQN